MELWQKYSPYLINLAVLLIAVLVWRAYKKVQGNAADWKSFAQRHAFVHTDNSALGEINGVVDGVKFHMKQEMERDYESMSLDQDRRYENNNSSVESMSFELASAPMSLKLQMSSSPRVQLLEKFAKLKGEKIEYVKTGDKNFDEMYSVTADPAEKQPVLSWLSDARRKVLLAYQGDNQFLLATRRLSISPAKGLGDLQQIEKLFSQLSALSSGLK